MRLKSYYSDTVEAAVAAASREIGPEAMLVYSREAAGEARRLGAYEVVFALPPTGGPAAPDELQKRPAPSGDAPPAGVSYEALTRELMQLRRQVSRLAGTLSGVRGGSLSEAPAAVLGEWNNRLLAAGLEPDICAELAGRILEREQAGEAPQPFAALLRAEFESMLAADSRIGAPDGPRAVALVGPPGAGKTTTLVKLAANYGLRLKRPACLVSMDMIRIGGAEQLRSFATILGVSFAAVEMPGALSQALEEQRGKELILIDTPGLGPGDSDLVEELASALGAHTEIEVQLTLSATMKTDDIRKAVDRFEPFRPGKLLFTKLDETATPATVLNEAIRSGKPVSFLATGQQIPEDLREATADLLLELAGIEPRSTARAAECRAAGRAAAA